LFFIFSFRVAVNMDHGYAIDCTVLVIVDQLDSGSYCLAPCPGGNPRQQKQYRLGS